MLDPFFSQDQVAIEANGLVESLLLQQAKTIHLFKKYAGDSNLIKILNQIQSIPPPKGWGLKSANYHSLIHLQWMTRSILLIHQPIAPQISDDMFLMELNGINERWSSILFRYLSSYTCENINSKDIRLLCESIDIMYNEQPGLYRALAMMVDLLLQAIGHEHLFECCDIKAIQYRSRFDPNYLTFNPLIMSIDATSMSFFWENYSIYKDKKACTIFQAVFAAHDSYDQIHETGEDHIKRLFPNESDLFFLVNESITKNKTFEQFFLKPIRRRITSVDKIDHIVSFINRFTDDELLHIFRPVLLLLEYDYFRSDQITFLQFVDKYMQYASSDFKDIFFKFKGDNELFSYITTRTGNKISLEDFRQHSFPFYLKSCMFNIDTDWFYQDSEKKTFFSIADSDRDKDLDFLDLIIGYAKAIEQLEDTELSAYQYSPAILKASKDVLIDIFSLLFLQNFDGSYVVTTEAADVIVNILCKDLDPTNPYFRAARQKIKYARIMNYQDLKYCFIPLTDCVCKLLACNYFEYAEEIAKDDPKLLKFVTTAKCLYFFHENPKNYTFDKDLDLDLFAAELILAFPDGYTYDFETTLFPEVMINRRNNSEPMLMFDSVSDKEILEELSNNMNAKIDLSTLPLLQSFLAFVGIVQLSPNIDKPDDLSAYVSKSLITNDSKLHKWEDVELLLRTNAITSIIDVADEISIESNLFKIIKEKFPLFAFVLKKQPDPSLKGIIPKLLNENKENTIQPKSLKEKVDNLIQVSDVELTKLFYEAIDANPIDHEALDEIYLQNMNLFNKLIQPYISKLSIKQLSGLWVFMDIPEVPNPDGKPIDNMYQLIGQQKYKSALKLAQTFDFIIECKDNILKHKTQKDYEAKMESELKEARLLKNDLKGSITFSILFNVFEKLKNMNSIHESCIKIILNSIVSCILDVKIDNSTDEMIASRNVKRMIRYLQYVKSKINYSSLELLSNHIDFISMFLECSFNSRFGLQYDFSNFMSAAKGEYFMSICNKFDHTSLMLKLQNVYQVDFPIQPVVTCFLMSLFDEGVELLKITLRSLQSDIIKLFIQILTHPIVFDVPSIDLESGEFSSITQSIAQRVSNLSPIVNNSPQTKALMGIFDFYHADEERILFQMQYQNNFDEALNGFLKLGPNFFKASYLMRLIITPAVAFGWKKFWLKMCRSYVNQYKPLLKELFAILNTYQMYYVLLDIEIQLGLHEEAIFAGLQYYKSLTKWEPMITVLSKVKREILELISCPPDDFPHEKILEMTTLQTRISLQQSYIKQCIKDNVPFNTEYDLIFSLDSTIKFAAHLLTTYQFGFLYEIKELPGIDFHLICQAALEMLAKKGEKQVPIFFRQLIKCEDNMYQEIVRAMLTAVFERVAVEKAFVPFVRQNVRGRAFRADLFIDFGFYNEAQEEIKTITDKSIVNHIKARIRNVGLK